MSEQKDLLRQVINSTIRGDDVKEPRELLAQVLQSKLQSRINSKTTVEDEEDDE